MQQWPLAQQHTVRSAAMQLLRACCGQFRSDVECEQHQRAWRCQSSNLTASVAGSNIQHVASVVSLPSVRATPPPTTAFCARRSTDTAPYAVTVLNCVDDNGRAHVLSQNERSRRWASQRPGGHYYYMNMPLRLFITSFAPPLPPCQVLRLQAGRPPPRCVVGGAVPSGRGP